MSKRYFGTDGIRGCVGEEPITPETVLKLGWAAGRVLGQGSSDHAKILVGKDTRVSGYLLESALEAGLSAAGVDIRLLGKAYDPFVLNADPSKKDFKVPDLLPPEEIGEARLQRRRELRDVVDQTVKNFEASPTAQLMDANFASAFRLMTSTKAREAFDLNKEAQKVRERYGMTRFGQCCLLARRLVEAGVRFVTINTFITVFDEISWDIHGSKPFTSIEGMKDIVAPMYDQGYSALLEDLFQRGMLDSTMVACLSEFGRTPNINPAGGRDHWPQCWTVSFAGGGVKGGRVVGKSDEIGGYPTERPVNPSEVVATIFYSLGLDLEAHLPGPQSRPFPLVDFGTQPIRELF